ncbi:MAG: phosphate acyltransferase PlsX [Planctomycetes bacterium]|nr:phosphate acyltransferase PlsX [Planctomycetota bacterium]
MRIAIDAMGGDYAPDEIVRGAADAAPDVPQAILTLVGRRERIETALPVSTRPPNVEIQHAADVIEMHEDPRRALLGKRDSSLHIGLNMVKHGRADAFISAGNTGALVGGATVPLFGLGCLEGVKRPAIAVPLPTETGFTALLDAGANKACKPVNLLQWAVMGSVYIKVLRQELHSRPRVALLNIGEERNKGTVLLQETYALLEKSQLHFIGNIEPHRIFSGKADVVICDGFVGNICLKAGEGMSNFLMGMIRSNGLAESEDIQKGIAKVEQRTDYSAVGGAPLLGIRGIVLKCHGRSKARAIANAVKIAAGFVASRLNDHIVQEIRSVGHVGWFSGWFHHKTKEEAEDE